MVPKELPVWLDGLTFAATAPPQRLPDRVDVAVIGGGYTGLSAARTLAQDGATVAVLEAQPWGQGASARNGGMVLTGLKLDVATLLARYGRAMARDLFAASLAAIDCVEQIVSEEGIVCGFARSGHLVVAAKPAHATALMREADVLARVFDHRTHYLTRQALRNEIGSDSYYGGLVDETSAGLDPARYLAGLVRAAQRAGAQLYPQTPVERIARHGTNFCLHTLRGAVRAGTLIVATGGYTGPVTPALRRRIVPLGSYSIATARLPAALAQQIIPRQRMIFDTRHLLHYFRLTPDLRLLFGGRAGFVPATAKTVRQSAEILQRALVRIYPQLRGVPIEYAWGGRIDVTFDMLPHLGSIEGMHYALGYAGHGVAMATYLGAKLAGCILARDGGEPFASLPLPAAPPGLYDGRPWFLPFVGAWYRLLDWVR